MRTLAACVVVWALGAAAAIAAEPLAHVEVAGTGETDVVLIHNTLADSGVWDSFLERNGERYTMHAVRLAGMGGSEALGLPDGSPLDEMVWSDATVAALAEHCADEGLEDVVVIGHGIGGMIGMRLAVAHPELVEGVVLVDTMPAHPLTAQGFRMNDSERVQYLLEGFIAATKNEDPIGWRVQWRAIAQRQTTDATEAERLSEMAGMVELDVWRRWMIELQAPDMTDELDESGVRVLGVGAVNIGLIQMFSTRVMVEEFWNLAFDGVENSEVTFFDESSHYIFLDRPEAFDAMVERFVAGEDQPEYSYREGGE